ncbi:RNA-directed DNA polymerase [Candidatus Uhrbacteria bacterium]|nr:RNA-directed DNA polymerase [Candidatus Uhrbacteria bacterium]
MAKRKRGGAASAGDAPTATLVADDDVAQTFQKIFAALSEPAMTFLSQWLGIPRNATDRGVGLARPYTLADAAAILENGTPYRRYFRPKSGGGVRRISEPAASVKHVQRRLLHVVFPSIPVHHASFAGLRTRSAIEAIEWHAAQGKPFFKVDLKNAYPSVSRTRLTKVLRGPLQEYLARAAPHLVAEEYEALINFVISICLDAGGLAQGAPTSLHLMNAARFELDCALAAYLRSLPGSYTYTAYVDDLIISRGDATEIPEYVRERIVRIVLAHGFLVNRSRRKRKVDYWPAGTGARRPVVLGLVPHRDGRVTISAKNRKRFRAALHHALSSPESSDAHRAQVAGVMGYLHMVYGDDRLPSELRVLYAQCRERFGRPKTPGGAYPDIDCLLAEQHPGEGKAADPHSEVDDARASGKPPTDSA